MKIIITLDYELFFGTDSGSALKSIVEPTEALIELCNKYNIKMNYFVDAGYLVKLKENRDKYLRCKNDYDLILNQLDKLCKNNHDLQLHIHPHWEDSHFDGEKWVFNTKRYRIHEFSDKEISGIVSSYKAVLNESYDKVFAYRAGGWCVQPFDKLKNAFKENNIWLDSTVYNQGFNDGSSHFYDFRNAPEKTIWKFNDDPVKEESDGFFTEIPISTTYFSPSFYWKFAFEKKVFKNSKHKILGDGSAIQQYGSERIMSMLLKGDSNCVSTDGMKSVYLERALKTYMRKFSENDYFVTIGHPKALTKYSLKNIEYFVKNNYKSHNFITYSDIG